MAKARGRLSPLVEIPIAKAVALWVNPATSSAWILYLRAKSSLIVFLFLSKRELETWPSPRKIFRGFLRSDDGWRLLEGENLRYEVVPLKRQFRSIPVVGKIFSQLTYGGLLEHARSPDSRKRFRVNGKEISALNIIKFPVSPYESIYRSKKLNNSSYHIYSALFVYEYVRHLVKFLDSGEENLSIGIVSPYRVQADLIENLLRTWKKTAKISVQCGTVHRFQGDECDIMFVVLNPPSSISGQGFLNRKNLINVAVSRARDSLFVLMPDANTEKIEKLGLVCQLESLLQESGCENFDSHALENEMFGSQTYLEENTFSTGHQSVNVYGKAERRYEVRSEDDAVDIQLMKN